MRDLGPDWRLAWADLPAGTYGLTDHRRKVITLQRGMTYEERRCTIAHEVEHARRGPVPAHRVMQEELLIDRKVSRLLLPSMRVVCDELMRHAGDYEDAATDLAVDVLMLEVRLSALWAKERTYFARRMADLLLTGA